MKITNTNSIYLMFLAYLNFTEFEILIMYYCCRPRLTSLFPKKARQQVNLPREDSQRWFPFFFFFFFFVSFPWDPWVGLDFFLLLLGGGGVVVGGLRVSGIVVPPGWFFTSGLLPENTGIQQEMNNGGGGEGAGQFIITLLYI